MPSSKIIRTHLAGRLRLSATKLVQIDHSTTNPWKVTAEDFRAAYRIASRPQGAEYGASVKIFDAKSHSSLFVNLSLPKYTGEYNKILATIGCCHFDPEVFQQIVKAFRARKSQARAAKAGA